MTTPLAQLNSALAGRYAVDREIGAGGMATVYLARDIKHARNVALKVLLPELGAILGVERFQAEIKVTANLQHPNLLPLFDSGEADGLLFYVMPYVEGESLRARLDREKQLPIDEALRIAGAVANALDYAHRHEVIHRDLKPENVLMHDGQPLVADFGIALAVSKAGGARITQTGLSLGTPQYMSPEQATGDRAIDGRTDIYSLGAMTYEMLTGEPPHVGSTSQAIIARVLTEKPRSIRTSRPNVPEHVEAAVERALEKLPADRWATAKEFGEALVNERLTSAGAASLKKGGRGKDAKPPMSVRLKIGLAIAAVVIGTLATKGAESLVRQPPVGRDSRFVLAMPDSLPLGPPRNNGFRIALSPDGSKLAFVTERGGASSIVVRLLGDPVARRIPGTEGGISPVFSPNGEWLAFVGLNDRKLRKVPVGGGAPAVLADSAGAATWGASGTILFAGAGGVFTVSSDGGPVTRVIGRDSASGAARFGQPTFLPGEKYALGTVGGNADPKLAVLRLSDGMVTPLGVSGFAPKYDGHGRILFGRANGTLYSAPFSLRKRALTGPPVSVAQGLQIQGTAAPYGVAGDGTLAFVSGGARLRQLVRVDRSGAATLLAPDERTFGWPRVSPDGKRIATEIGAAGGVFDIWVYDLGQQTISRLTTNGTGYRTVGWTPDGRRVVFIAPDSGGVGAGARLTMIQSIPWDNSGPLDTLARVTERHLWEATIGPARSWLLVRTTESTLNVSGDFILSPLDAPAKLRPFIVSPANEYTPRLSPDGRFVAYASDETGTIEVYVRPVPGPGGRLKVSNGGGVTPVWAPGGRELFYRTPTRMVAASLTFGTEMTVVQRDSLFEDTYYNDVSPQLDAFPDGKGLVMIRTAPGVGATLNVIVNWRALLKKQ